MPKKKRVPEVLWRLFRSRALPLLKTVVSLLPPPPPLPAGFRCSRCARLKERRCLGCCRRAGEAEAASFILRPDDPSDYRKLLTQCYAVVDDDAPPYTYGYGPSLFNTQREVVQRLIMRLLMEEKASMNVITNGFDQFERTSTAVQLLTSSAWCLLIDRVGGIFMSFLLTNASVFVPTSGTKYSQVAGPPITKLRHRRGKRKADYHFQHCSLIQSGAQKKRKVEHKSRSYRSGCLSSESLMELVEHDDRSCANEISVVKATVGSEVSTAEEATVMGMQVDSDQIQPKVRKHKEPLNWQQHRKRKRMKIAKVPTALCEDMSVLPVNNQCKSNFSSKKMPSVCPCCLQLQAMGKSYKGAQIYRKMIFYNLESSPGFPERHVLRFLRPDVANSVSLLCQIFNLSNVNSLAQPVKCFHKDAYCCNCSSCLFHSTAKSLKNLIRRSRSCQYLRLLEKHCGPPLSQGVASENVPTNVELLQKLIKLYEVYNYLVELSPIRYSSNPLNEKSMDSTGFDDIMSYCSETQVVSFIWAVCRSIVPTEMLGSPSNWRVLRRNIYKFIALRRFENFSLKQCMHKLKASGFTFLEHPSPSCRYSCNEVAQSAEVHARCNKLGDVMSDLRHKMLERWIHWFFSCLVVPLVSANFYVTESEHGKQEVYYYRKSTWKNLTRGAMDRLTGQVFTTLEDAAVQKVVAKRSYGFSKVRFRPKPNGLRMLVNLKSPTFLPAHRPSHGIARSRSVNVFLRDTCEVLKCLKLREPEKLGSTVSDYNDVYRKLYPFLVGLKKGGSILPNVYIVVSDVVKAFDSVDQDKLLSIMKDVIREPSYILVQSSEMNFKGKYCWIRDKFLLAGKNAGTMASSSHGVTINQIGSKTVKRQDILLNLKEHIKRNILMFGKSFYLQRIGIPQGSILSPLLCSFYFGYLEGSVILPFLRKASEAGYNNSSTTSYTAIGSGCDEIVPPRFLMLRFVDDFLFLSTSGKQAAHLFSRLKRGFRQFNCQMNEKKFSVNFCDTLETQKRLDTRIDGIQFVHWGGLLINSQTLEIQADYSRYLKNHLRSTLTVSWQGNPASQMKARLHSFLRPKCHAIFFDSTINSAAVIRLNIYQIFVLCAMKFHCYVRELSYICKFSAQFHFKAIRKSFRYMNMLIKRRMRTQYLPDICPVLKSKKGEVEWLGLVAFVRVLKRKQSRHTQLLKLLQSQLLKHRISEHISPELSYAVDKGHSSDLWQVKY